MTDNPNAVPSYAPTVADREAMALAQAVTVDDMKLLVGGVLQHNVNSAYAMRAILDRRDGKPTPPAPAPLAAPQPEPVPEVAPPSVVIPERARPDNLRERLGLK